MCRWFNAEKMHMRRNQSPDLVRRATNEEMHCIRILRIRFARPRTLFRIVKRTNKRSQMKLSLGVPEMKWSRRRERPLAILDCESIRRNKAGTQNQALECR